MSEESKGQRELDEAEFAAWRRAADTAGIVGGAWKHEAGYSVTVVGGLLGAIAAGAHLGAAAGGLAVYLALCAGMAQRAAEERGVSPWTGLWLGLLLGPLGVIAALLWPRKPRKKRESA